MNSPTSFPSRSGTIKSVSGFPGASSRQPKSSISQSAIPAARSAQKKSQDDFTKSLQQQIYLLELETRYLRSNKSLAAKEATEDVTAIKKQQHAATIATLQTQVATLTHEVAAITAAKSSVASQLAEVLAALDSERRSHARAAADAKAQLEARAAEISRQNATIARNKQAAENALTAASQAKMEAADWKGKVEERAAEVKMDVRPPDDHAATVQQLQARITAHEAAAAKSAATIRHLELTLVHETEARKRADAELQLALTESAANAARASAADGALASQGRDRDAKLAAAVEGHRSAEAAAKEAQAALTAARAGAKTREDQLAGLRAEHAVRSADAERLVAELAAERERAEYEQATAAHVRSELARIASEAADVRAMASGLEARATRAERDRDAAAAEALSVATELRDWRRRGDQWRRAADVIERERYLYGSVPFERWILLPACALIQMSVGSFYAWSVYNSAVANIMNNGNMDPDAPGHVSTELIAETFYVSVAFFGVATCVAGPWLERYGPKRMSLIGAALFFAGNLLSALACSLRSIALLYLGYGFFGGLGIGMSYLIPVAVLQQWYPDRKGFSAGISVGSFGLGSVIASFSQAALLSQLAPVKTFIVLGSVYFCVHGLASLLLRFPPPDYHVNATQMHLLKDQDHGDHIAGGHVVPKQGAAQPATQTTVRDAEQGTAVPLAHDHQDEMVADPMHNLRSHEMPEDGSHPHVLLGSAPMQEHEFVDDAKSLNFWIIYAFFFLSVIPGLVIVSRAANMVTASFGQTTSTSTWVVGVNGMFNVVGRLVSGILSDKVSRLNLVGCYIIYSIIVMVTMYISLSQNIFGLFIYSMWSLTGAYGATCAVIPGIIGDVFGSGHIGALYGLQMTAWAAGGVIGGVGFTALIEQQKSAGVSYSHVYDVCLFSMIPLAAIGFCVVMMFKLKRSRNKKAVTHPMHTQVAISSTTGGRYPTHAADLNIGHAH
ncbi:major facilitator superfamily domain-containing protein [Blastocladiella britannica]|nr:major facilitator superfamily domain-containing protein [Blastocladiella britannica]